MIPWWGEVNHLEKPDLHERGGRLHLSGVGVSDKPSQVRSDAITDLSKIRFKVKILLNLLSLLSVLTWRLDRIVCFHGTIS